MGIFWHGVKPEDGGFRSDPERGAQVVCYAPLIVALHLQAVVNAVCPESEQDAVHLDIQETVLFVRYELGRVSAFTCGDLKREVERFSHARVYAAQGGDATSVDSSSALP